MARGGKLGEAAEGALDDGDGSVSPDQEHLPGTDHAKVKFVGMAWETLEVPELRSEVDLNVKGTVVAHGEEVMANGDIRQVAKVKVSSVTKKGSRSRSS